jgi:O-antigen/teichoic acid export membrane protein
MPLRSLLDRLPPVLRAYNTSAGRQAARNLVGTAICTVLGQLCTLGALLILTRGLSEDYGVFSYALFAQQYLLLFTTGALAQVVVRDGIRQPDRQDEIQTSFLAATAALSTVLCMATISLALLSPAGPGERLVLIFLALGNVPGCMNVRSWFELHHRQTSDSIVTLGGDLATLAALILLYASGQLSLASVGLVYGLKWFVVSSALLAVYHATVRPIRLVFSVGQLKQMLHSAWPLMLASLVAMVPFFAGGFLLRVLAGKAEASIFGVANQVALAFLTFAQLANRIVRPHMSASYGVDPSFLRKLILFKAGFLTVLVALALGGSVIVIYYLLPPFYRPALRPTAILLAGALVTAIGRTASNYLVVFRSERLLLVAQTVGAGLYFVGCFLLIPLASYAGAATMTTAAGLLATTIILIGVRQGIREAALTGKLIEASPSLEQIPVVSVVAPETASPRTDGEVST